MAESMGLAIARHGVVYVERARLDDATPLTVGQERAGGQAN
jgi:fumarate hydratase class II